MPDRLILHIGQTKAGSTALQNYLENQRTNLLRHGILFPECGFERSNPFVRQRTAGHLSLVRGIAGGQVAEFEAERGIGASHTIILSAENLFLDRPDEEISALGNYFADHSITLALIARDPAEWLRSRYVEDVMSGYVCSTLTFRDFCDASVQRGVHDYAARLDHLAALLRPRAVRVVNYAAALGSDGLVPAFLRAVDLPVTDAALARSIRANDREKDWFLIEGKRRLNHATRSLRVLARLELEAEVREKARALRATLPPGQPLIADVATPLSPSACRTVGESTRRLVEDFALSPPLAEPVARPAERYQHRRRYPGTDELVSFGLATAVRIRRRDAYEALADKAAAPKVGVDPLGCPGSHLLIDLLARATVSLHLDSAATAVWAACYNGKLPVVLATQAAAVAECDRLLSLKLASEIVCVTQLAMLGSVLHARRPDALVVSADADPDWVSKAWALAAPAAILALTGRVVAESLAIAERFDLAVVATDRNTHMLARREGSARGKPT